MLTFKLFRYLTENEIDLRPGKMTKAQLNAAFSRVSQKHLDKVAYTAKGKLRSQAGYDRAVKKSKQHERPDELENAEQGGTEYWSFRNR